MPLTGRLIYCLFAVCMTSAALACNYPITFHLARSHIAGLRQLRSKMAPLVGSTTAVSGILDTLNHTPRYRRDPRLLVVDLPIGGFGNPHLACFRI